jgi:hypothetical protein
LDAGFCGTVINFIRGFGQKYPVNDGKIDAFEQIPLSAKMKSPDKTNVPNSQITPRVMMDSSNHPSFSS